MFRGLHATCHCTPGQQADQLSAGINPLLSSWKPLRGSLAHSRGEAEAS
jgi:hypothetical protein